MHSERGILLSPAYDLLNVILIYPQDKEDLALTLGGRKRKVKRSDFDQFAMSLGLSDLVRDNIYKDFVKQKDRIFDLISRSFLTEEYKKRYIDIFENKMRQIRL